MDMLACRRLGNRIYIHHRVSLSSPSRAVWRRYKPHIQHRYIFIRDRMRLGCGRLVRQINHGRAIHVDERHTYLVYRPRAASLALQVTSFRPRGHRLFLGREKASTSFSSTHPCFGMYDLGMSLGIQRCVYIPFPGLHDHAENTRTPVCCRHSFLGACQRLFV